MIDAAGLQAFILPSRLREGPGVGAAMTGAFKPRNTEKAKRLRNAATPAERRLWQYLSKRQVGNAKFSRQMPIGLYICDFLCRSAKLVVELDGVSHDMRVEEDACRTRYIENEGYTVLRFTNSEVLANIEGVVTEIGRALGDLNMPTPSPSRKREGSQ